MRRDEKIAVGTIAVMVLGFAAYWRLSRFDRIADDAANSVVRAEDWQLLRAHPDDPRVLAALPHELEAASLVDECSQSVERVQLRAGAVLAKHPTNDDKSLAAITRMIGMCPSLEPLKWTSRPTQDVIAQLKKSVRLFYLMRPDRIASLLAFLAPPVTQDVIDVVVASGKPYASTVDSYVAKGFPAMGAPFVGFDVDAARLDPRTDPRISLAIVHWLGGVEEGIEANDATTILRYLETAIAPPRLDTPSVKAMSRSAARVADVAAICAKLVRADDAELVRIHFAREPGPLGICLGALDGLPEVFQMLVEAARKPDTKASVEAIVKVGWRAIPALRKGMADPNGRVRALAARAFVRIDRHAYAVEAARLFRAALPVNRLDAELALDLLGNDQPFEVHVDFAVLHLGDAATSERAIAHLKKSARADAWIPVLFENLSVPSTITPETLRRYETLLVETPDVAGSVATFLERALALAGGAPERIFWLAKRLALATLAAQGTSAQVRTVQKFLADTSSYEEVTPTGARETKTFKDLATRAAAAMNTR